MAFATRVPSDLTRQLRLVSHHDLSQNVPECLLDDHDVCSTPAWIGTQFVDGKGERNDGRRGRPATSKSLLDRVVHVCRYGFAHVHYPRRMGAIHVPNTPQQNSTGGNCRGWTKTLPPPCTATSTIEI